MNYKKRIHWDRHRPEFLKLGFVMALAITFMAFNYTTHKPQFLPFEEDPIEFDCLIIPPPTVHEKKVPLPPPPPKRNPVLKVKMVTKPIFEFKEIVAVKEKLTTEFEVSPQVPFQEEAPMVKIHVPEEKVDKDIAVSTAERMPIYGDCSLDSKESDRRKCTEKNLMEHIYAYVKYPSEARRMGIEGTVFVSFIVDKSGEIEDINILRDIGFGCGEVVIDAVKKLQQFLPGKQNGRPVRVVYRLPVKFKLE